MEREKERRRDGEMEREAEELWTHRRPFVPLDKEPGTIHAISQGPTKDGPSRCPVLDRAPMPAHTGPNSFQSGTARLVRGLVAGHSARAARASPPLGCR